MKERSEMIEWIRGEIVGPGRILKEPSIVEFEDSDFTHDSQWPNGPIVWKPGPEEDLQEVLYFDRESPFRKYGTGLLHPEGAESNFSGNGETTLRNSDTVGVEQGIEGRPQDGNTDNEEISEESSEKVSTSAYSDDSEDTDDFEINNPDLRLRSTIGLSFCASLEDEGEIIIELPKKRKFFWQEEESDDFQLNGYYEPGRRIWNDENGKKFDSGIWRRKYAASENSKVTFNVKEFSKNNPKQVLELSDGCPIKLTVQIFPRKLEGENNKWIFTVVLKNTSDESQNQDHRLTTLFQSFFIVNVFKGRFVPYPESQRSIEDHDPSEQSLSMLYRESPIWAIGHGCAAGWDSGPDEEPLLIYADDLPAVELPSMTPDIKIDGDYVKFSMRELALLSDDGTGLGWESLENLFKGYDEWIRQKEKEAVDLPKKFQGVSDRHFKECRLCLERIKEGIDLLKKDKNIRDSFRLANLSMLLQQIATKQIKKRDLIWNVDQKLHVPESDYISPWDIYRTSSEKSDSIGGWRAFQIAFLLMSIRGITDEESEEREMVDLIWFPTGGGKTEAYLAVMAFYMFNERLQIKDGEEVRRDGTNILMRYTLRMLTTQQFERAASLICSMEFLRRHPEFINHPGIKGTRFSLGLWIGGTATPNKIKKANEEIKEFKAGNIEGNPLVLTDCPWCRTKIGKFGRTPFLRGISEDKNEGPLLYCPDGTCEFGSESREDFIPVEVIDQRIYENPPSVIISTADKLALIAYRPEAGSLFGRKSNENSGVNKIFRPPQLIIQDELHLISGPLGTMYAVYEGIIERLCTEIIGDIEKKPKIIASTATIRNAEDQVKSLYSRSNTKLFPCPALKMEDSFFGKYSREEDGKLSKGRIYLGINANNFHSLQTTQVRAFSAALFRPYIFESDEKADPWWTLLAFYNSIRELGGGKTLFDSDIKSRLKFLFNREGGFPIKERRNLINVNELTSRLPQTGIKSMMDRLSLPYNKKKRGEVIDACLASNIIEVGVDIDRLSLMGVIGQPKTTSTYIQVTGRVGRRWWERPGLVLMLYSPSKSRDISHFEQFHSYHRRLYEFVEPTSATPFAIPAIKRGLIGALLSWARQFSREDVKKWEEYESHINDGFRILENRARKLLPPEDFKRSLKEMEIEKELLFKKWRMNPQKWEDFPQQTDGEYLMLWPGQFCLPIQKEQGVTVPSSMRQVDMEGEIEITKGYADNTHNE